MAPKKVPVNVKTKWGDKSTVSSDKISAETLEEASDELSKLPEWGEFDGHTPYDYDA